MAIQAPQERIPPHRVCSMAAALSYITEPERKTAVGGEFEVIVLDGGPARRSPFLQDVPTLKESGIDVDADAWMGLIAPGDTPKLVVAKINKDVVQIIKQPSVRERLAAQLMEPVGSSPEGFRARIDSEIVHWAPVIKAADVKIN